MPDGIILKSASHEASEEARQKNLEAVIESAGYEVAKEEEALPVEPKREDFKSEEEFEAAQVAWEDKQKPEEHEEEEEIEAAPRPKKPSRKERAEARGAARATAEMQRKLDEAQARIAELEGKNKKDDAPLVEPKREDFDDEAEYKKALIAWAFKDKELKDAQKAQDARAEQVLRDYWVQVEEAKEEHPDWNELFAQFEKNDISIGSATQNMIFELENGAEVSYYLARHPAFARKLGQMPQLTAIAEVVRLSERLKTGTPAPSSSDNDEEKLKPPKPKVPAPVRTVNTGGRSNAALTFAELAAKPNYAGKAKDLRALQAKERG